MEKGLLMLSLSILCLWLLLDEFFGTKKLSNVAAKFTPNIPTVPEKINEALNGDPKVKEKNREDAKKAIDKQPNTEINKAAKDKLKEMVDHFYGPQPN